MMLTSPLSDTSPYAKPATAEVQFVYLCYHHYKCCSKQKSWKRLKNII